MSDRAVAIGVDVGGTKLLMGVVHADGSVSNETRVRTRQGDPAWVSDCIVRYAREHGPGLPIGVAADGAVDRNGVVRFGTYIPWNGYPLASLLNQQLGVPAFVQNDVTVAAWGEYILDAQRRSVVVIAAGTGVGGGAVVEGRLLIGRGAAMEIGHLPARNGTRVCGCGKVGCLETVASGSAVAEEYHSRREVDRGASAGAKLSALDVVAAAQKGDGLAISVVRQAGAALGEAAAAIASVLDPDRIVLCGGLVQGAGDLLFEAARSSFVERLAPPNLASANILERTVARVDPTLLGAASLAANLAGQELRLTL